MLRASSLFYALILSLLVSLITISIISMGSFQKIEIEIYDRLPRLISNCQSAEAILLSDYARLTEGKTKILREFDDTTEVKYQNWGVWKVGTVLSKEKQDSVHYSFLFGSKLAYPQAALFVKNGVSGLAISGATELRGDVYVPGGRVKPAFIGGQSFVGEQLVNGKVLEAPRNFPRVPNRLMTSLTSLDHSDMNLIEYLDSPDSVNVDFINQTTLIQSNDSISILDKTFFGNVIIESKKAIYVSAFCELQNVRCNAPRIYIASGFKGSVQCLASETINVQNNAELTYPSALIVISKDEDKEAYISMEDQAYMEGVVWMNSKKNGIIELDNGSVVIGQIISDNAVSLKGEVNGQIFTKETHLKTGSGFYVNHLLNTSIEMKLPKWFVGMSLQQGSGSVLKMMEL